jgi:Ca2+-binding EF-hand superfamily protein
MLWSKYDGDQNGVLDIGEAKKCLVEVYTVLLGRQLNPTKNEQKDWFNSLDKDRSGTIDK